jgi:hypothetical protein
MMAQHPVSQTDRRNRFRVGRCGKYERSQETLERQRASARRFWSDLCKPCPAVGDYEGGDGACAERHHTMKRQDRGQTKPAVATLVRNLMRYDGQLFLGSLKVTERHRLGKQTLRTVAAKDAHGASLGNFKTQRAAAAAIDRGGRRR